MSRPNLNTIWPAAALAGALWIAAGHAAPAAKPAKAGAKPAADTSRVLVWIGREAITRAMVQQRIDELPEQYRANYSTPDGRRQLLDRIIEEKVWLAQAMKNGVADRPAVKSELEQQRRNLLIRTWLNEVMASNPAPSDSECKLYYDAHESDFRTPASVTLRHILTRSENEAKNVIKWARSPGQDWDKLCTRYSADTLTRKNGGSLGTVTREGVFAGIGTQPALAESAMALGKGKIGGPYKTANGWHVLKVDEVKEESVRPFDQVRSFISRQLGSQKSQDYYQGKLKQAREALGVKPDSAAIKSFVSQKKTAREMFQDAQSAGPPQARIDAYRKVVEDYPDADVSPQAQFMVGFIYSEELKNYDEADTAFRELLSRYPKSELAASAQWMVDHMRTEEAPNFLNLEADSSQSPPKPHHATGSSTGKP